VISPDQDLRPAHVKQTHAVDILAFVEAQEIPPLYFETPYYLAPAPGGEKDYALLRETLRRTKKIGIAYVVIDARQHLAVLVPQGQSLVLNTLRWSNDPLAMAGIDFSLEDEDVDDWAEIELTATSEQPAWGCTDDWALCHDGLDCQRTGFSSHAFSGRRVAEVGIDSMADLLEDEDGDDFDCDADLFEELFSGKACRTNAPVRNRAVRRQRHLRSHVRSRRAPAR